MAQAHAVASFRAAGRPDDVSTLDQRAVQAMAAGDCAAARRALRKAMQRAPRDLSLRHMFAELLLRQGRPDIACEALAAAVRLAPADAPTRLRLGRARFADGRVRDAAAAFLRAARLDRQRTEGAIEAAHMLRLLHRDADALSHLARAVAQNPGSAAARHEYALALIDADQAADALRLLDTETPWAGHHDAARSALIRVEALRRAGDTDAARPLLASIDAPPRRFAVRYHRLRRTLAPDAGGFSASDLTGLEAAAGRHDERPGDRITAWFQLAQDHLARGDGDGAFAALRQGHGLLARAEPFRPAHYRAFVDDMIGSFTPESLHSEHGARNDHAGPIFIVGMPRSGTTLTEQILGSHHAVFAAGERQAIPDLLRRLGGERRVRPLATLPPAQLDRHARDYLATLEALAPGAARITDKLPGNYQYIGLIARLLPRARFIHCMRDPRDIGFSIYTRRFDAAHPYAHDLGNLGFYIAQERRLMAHWHGLLPERIMRVRLTEWVHHFDRTLQRVLAFLDLDQDPACARFFEFEREIRTASRHQVRAPINPNGFGRWRPYHTHLSPLIEALATT